MTNSSDAVILRKRLAENQSCVGFKWQNAGEATANEESPVSTIAGESTRDSVIKSQELSV
jgi:hypothetical protein